MGSLRISIITVVKNGHEFIEQTMNSVLSQKYDDFEYIIIDGVSTDGTVDVVRSYESRITKWISESDGGIAEAFNKGLSFCTGDYIIFLNSDDRLANPNVLNGMVKNIIENRFPMLIYGDYIILDRASGMELYSGSVNFSSKNMRRGGVFPQPCLLTHRSFFEKYGIFDTRFKIAMDYELLLRGALKEGVVHVSLVVTCIRDGGMSVVNRSLAIEEIIQALKKNGYICSVLSERRMRSYFSCRSFLRSFLNKIGVYQVFFSMRNRMRNRPSGV